MVFFSGKSAGSDPAVRGTFAKKSPQHPRKRRQAASAEPALPIRVARFTPFRSVYKPKLHPRNCYFQHADTKVFSVITDNANIAPTDPNGTTFARDI